MVVDFFVLNLILCYSSSEIQIQNPEERLNSLIEVIGTVNDIIFTTIMYLPLFLVGFGFFGLKLEIFCTNSNNIMKLSLKQVDGIIIIEQHAILHS